jgi:hydroxymethyl cephem carbamoyltransferase
MLIFAVKPGHDGSITAIRDGSLLYSLEAEKDSFGRYSPVTPTTFLQAAELVGDIPDVIALGGWEKPGTEPFLSIGAGYEGADRGQTSTMNFFGKDVQLFSSSHERSHIMMALGMAPRTDAPQQAVLVWEGDVGSFYLLDEEFHVTETIPVMKKPGSRYAFLFALADPTFPDEGEIMPRLGDAGKLMALAAYGAAEDADNDILNTVERILTIDSVSIPVPKSKFRDSSIYNSGVESQEHKIAAALLTSRLFDKFYAAAVAKVPANIPLRISGGCGLNCDWNSQWVQTGHFSDVFVPPCTNDSGSAIGTAIDAQFELTGDPYIHWDVYSGLEFVLDVQPNRSVWQEHRLDAAALASALASGRIAAWVQGRWEIGPRALGNRSILAEPFQAQTRGRLNHIKKRENYRPIAPCCRVEDLSQVFDDDREDPYMLYFRRLRTTDFGAVTHVDGSARAQTVSRDSNEKLHSLLTAFAARTGAGVLCNTSLNFNGHGFINRMSDLAKFCEDRGITDMVVGDRWYQRADSYGIGR